MITETSLHQGLAQCWLNQFPIRIFVAVFFIPALFYTDIYVFISCTTTIISFRALPPLAFRPLKALKILDLGHNKIHNISNEAFYGARAVDTLDLSDNLLNSVPNEAMIAMENLAYLELSENPIKKIGKRKRELAFTVVFGN